MNYKEIFGELNYISLKSYIELEKNIGVVSVIHSKSRGVDIIFMLNKESAESVRSVTELLNVLWKNNVSYEERQRVLEYVDKRLIYLKRRKTRFNQHGRTSPEKP